MPEEQRASERVRQFSSPTSEEDNTTKHVSDHVQLIYDIFARRNAEVNASPESLAAPAPASTEFSGNDGSDK